MTENLAIDTETVNGNIVCLCNSKGACIEHPTLDECLKFITTNHNYRRYFLWNIMYDVDAMLKGLPMENLRELFGDESKTAYKGYDITYLGRNNVSISTEQSGKRYRTMLWDLAQFYDYHSLKEMSKRYIGEDSQKMESDVIEAFVSQDYEENGKRLKAKGKRKSLSPEPLALSVEDSLAYYEKHSREIREYCVGDCVATKELADLMEERMEWEGYDFSTPYSVGNTAMKFFRQYLGNPSYPKDAIPRIHPSYWRQENAERRTLEKLWESIARGGWNDCFQRGKFDHIWDYDIVSAYPTIMRDIPYWEGNWVETTDKDIIDKADYGLIDVTIKNLKLPLMPEIYQYFDNSIIKKEVISWVNHSILHSTIDHRPFKTTLTTDQYHFFDKLADVKVNGGWILEPSHTLFPLREVIDTLIKKKFSAKEKHGKQSVEYMLAKKIMNSASGKFKQKFHSKYTWFFYPHVYAKITWRTKEIVADLITANDAWDDLVSVSTDGAVFTRKLNNVDLSGQLGSFELTKMDNFVQIGNGIYYGYTTEGKLYQRMRGFHIFKYNLPEIIESQPDKTVVEVKTRRPLHLRECFKHHKKLTISDTDTWVDVIKHVNINKEIKRKWVGRYESINDLLSGRKLKSTAWEIREGLALSKEAAKGVDSEAQTRLDA